MNIQTKFHGEQEINTDEIIKFSSGIPGFLEEKEFTILPIEGTDLYVLQSVRSQQVAFIITDPFLIFPQYEFDLRQETIEALGIQSEKEVATFVILTVKEPFQETTANLQAPVIINQNKKLGKQLILTNTSYQTRHKIVSQEQGAAK
jgi:flagellar assembly factor FliW